MAALERASLLIEQGKYDLAKQEIMRALAEEPQNWQAHALLGICLIEQNEFEAARKSAAAAIEAAPDEGFAHYVLARALYGERRYAKARDVVEQAIRLDPSDAGYYWLLAAIEYSFKQLNKALEAVDLGLAQQPDHPGCGNLRALILRDMKRRRESDVMVDGLLVSDPNNAQTHATKGWGAVEDNDYAKAREHFREALRIDPNHTWAQQGYLVAVKGASKLYQWASRVTRFHEKNRFMVSMIVMSTVIATGYLINVMMRINPFLTRRVVLPTLAIALLLFGACFLVDPIYNLILRLQKKERVILTQQQILVSNYTAAAFIIGIIATLGFAFFGATRAGWTVAGGSLLALPVVVAMGMPRGRKGKMAIYTVVMLALGVGFYFASRSELSGAMKQKEADKALAALYVLGTLGAAWLPKDRTDPD